MPTRPEWPPKPSLEPEAFATLAIWLAICRPPSPNTESVSAGLANSRKRSKSAIAVVVIATTAPAPVGSVFDRRIVTRPLLSASRSMSDHRNAAASERRNPASETTETIAIVLAAFSLFGCKSRWARMTATASLVRPRACLTVLVSAACRAKPCIAVLTIGAAQGLIWPASRWASPIAAQAMRKVETLAPPANRAARNDAACSESAGKTGWP